MSRYTLVLDVAGRVSKAISGYEYITCAGVGFDSSRIEDARQVLDTRFPKWRDADDVSLSRLVQNLSGLAVTSLVLRQKRREPHWSAIWKDADDFCCALRSKTNLRAGFAKAAQFIRYHLFAECSARLTGECVRKDGRPRVLDMSGRGLIETKIICDSDIQGKDNLEGLQRIWDSVDRWPQGMLARFNLVVRMGDAVVTTEEAEPLLLYADHLAGLFHAEVTAAAKPPGVTVGAMQAARGSLRDMVCVIDKDFDARYRALYGKGKIGRELWG